MVRLKMHFFTLLLVVVTILQCVTAGLPRTRRAVECSAIPPTPHNAEVKCHSTACAVSCLGDSKFDFGGNKIVIVCKNNTWAPIVKHIKTISDCTAPCDPPCEFGRTCFAKNHCGCPNNFGGRNCSERKECTKGQIYKTCGDSCTLTCKALRLLPCTSKCVEGCTCANGWSKDASGICIPVTKCPCFVGGIEHTDGHFELKNKWTCNTVKKGYASMTGDPHYTSIDGRRFDFMGHCVYTLLKHQEFAIEGENVACAGTSEGIKFEDGVKNAPSCTKSLIIRVQRLTIHLLQNREVMINGRKVTKFPFTMQKTKVSQISSNFILAEFADGVEVKWDGSTTAYVTVPEKYYGHVKGLLGTYNNNANDDMTKSDGTPAKSVEDLGNSWKVDESCPNVKPVPHPCEVYPEKHVIAEHHCSPLKTCHAAINPQSFYDNCLYDMCQCRNNEVKSCLCPILANYVSLCQLQNITIDSWKTRVPICGMQCPSGQISQCGNACLRTCRSLLNPNCKSSICIDDCYCPPGHALSGKWSCIEQHGANCSSFGDPHYKTFDNRQFSFQGKSSYYLLVLDKELIVEATNWFCIPNAINQGITCTNSLTGLCGNFNGDMNDEFKTPQGVLTSNSNDFGNSWKTDDTSLDVAFMPHPCDRSADIAANAETLCKVVKGAIFSECHALVNPNSAYENCRFDVCACTVADRAKCSCPVIAAYGEECTKMHTPIDWRNSVESCTGQVYQPCGDICGRTCRDLSLPCTMKDECVEGCNCPPGQTLDDTGKCINRDQCPCTHGKIQLKKGQQITRDLGKGHTCNNARWSCEPQSNAWCSIVGYAHYTTFDGKKYDFMGTCSYYLVKHATFTIEINNAACLIPSCSRSLTVRVRKDRLELLRDLEVKLNVTLWNDVEVRWDGNMAIYVQAPGTLYGQNTQGLCGTFNGNVHDDWSTSENKIIDNVENFTKSWKSNENCDVVHLVPKPCEQNLQKKQNAKRYCDILQEVIFSECHAYVDVKSAIADCQFDTCASNGGLSEKDARCHAISAYVDQCTWSDVKLPEWRNQVTGCEINCPADQEYQTCGSPCGRTCLDVPIPCISKCVEGCNCPEGQTLDREGGTCIPVSRCPCHTCINADWVCTKQKGARCTALDATYFTSFDGHNFNVVSVCPAYLLKTETVSVVLLSEEKCTNPINNKCTRPLLITMDKVKIKILSNKMAVFNSVRITKFPYKQQNVKIRIASSSFIVDCNAVIDPEAMYETCLLQLCNCHTVPDCVCPIYSVYASQCAALNITINWRRHIKMCAIECPAGQEYQVCHDPCMRSCRDIQQTSCERKCVEGCNCPEGRTLNDKDECIPKEECKCVHENKDRRIEVDKDCEYYLIKQEELSVSSGPSCNQDQSSCVTNLKLDWGSESLTLTEGDAQVIYNGRPTAPLITNLNLVLLEESSMSLLVKLMKLDVELRWDKADKIDLRVPPTFIDKTMGLCGTFGSDMQTDLKLWDGKSTGNVALFARSWQVHPRCISQPRFDNNSACDGNDRIKSGKINECDVMKQSIFEPCQSTAVGVLIDAFYSSCMSEKCSCVQDNSQPCTCAIIGELAMECSKALNGANFDWRPLAPKCDDCTHSCAAISATANIKCSRRCVEGCRCPNGQSIDGFGKCIPTVECPCLHNNIGYQPGENECQAGRWACQEAPLGRCTNIGLAHYTTFDGKTYNFRAQCQYYLLRMPQFSVQINVQPCLAENMVDAPRNGTLLCKTTKIQAGNVRIEITQMDKKILVDGQQVTVLPVIKRSAVSVRRASDSTIIVEHIENGVEIWWNDDGTLRIDVPPSYEEKTEGEVTLNLLTFINSWRVSPTCNDPPEISNPCDRNSGMSQRAAEICDILNKPPFRACHGLIDVQAYIDICKFELCACKLMTSCACSVFREYAQACADHGIDNLPWTQQVTECAEKCPTGQVFRTCADSCRRTCDDVSLEGCTSKCVEGCACPRGQALDAKGNCVLLNQCPCIDRKQRICSEGRWSCTIASAEEIMNALAGCATGRGAGE
ncbi:hypothetical protein B566_EDAN015867 [Ephemera danica]|nr:hypothetical protein B566_EDAN015867 [Ephemera danica]